jgi:hypothetical protein
MRRSILIGSYSSDVHHEYLIDYARRQTMARIRGDAESEAAGADEG